MFDVGRVLFQWDLRHLFAKIIADAAELDWFLAHVVTPQWHFQHDAGRDLDSMLAERIALFPQWADAIRAYRARFNETIPAPVPGMPALVAQLAAAQVPLFIISNFGAEFWDGFRPTQPIFDHFRDAIISGREGLIKPDPAIYRLALARFGLNAADALFIDDVAANVASARAVGIDTHHFHNAAALRQWLVEKMVLPA
ncbi:MAG: HAD-IA family hydrolase [Sphingopyxis sp.]